MKYAISDTRLKQIAEASWPRAHLDEFERIWENELLPAMRLTETRSSEICQHVFAKPNGPDFENPNVDSSSEPWWEQGAQSAGLMEQHLLTLETFSTTLYAKHGAGPRRRREEIEKARNDVAEKRELDRVAKLKGEFRGAALQRFRAAGGTVQQFDECFGKLWAEHLQKQAVEETAAPRPAYMRDF
jgi:hypothetical protein